MDKILQDIRFAVKGMTANPGFTAVAVLTVALGIGATSALFTIINGVLLRPLPYDQSHRLLQISGSFEGLGLSTVPVSVPEYLDYREQSRWFEEMAAFSPWSGNLIGSDSPERSAGATVTGSFFPTFGVQPVMGRVFLSQEEQAGNMVAEVRRMKKEPGEDMVILGSGSIVAKLAPEVLIDEYQVLVNPVVLGEGRTMFEGVKEKLTLKLTKSRAFGNGNVLLCYEPAA